MVVPVTPASLRRWENPEDMDIHEVGGCGLVFMMSRRQTFVYTVTLEGHFLVWLGLGLGILYNGYS